MLTIKILGTGCAKCKRLEKLAREVVSELGIEANFIKVDDLNEITQYPLVTTPGLVINEKVVSSGRLPGKAEITSWVSTALMEEEA